MSNTNTESTENKDKEYYNSITELCLFPTYFHVDRFIFKNRARYKRPIMFTKCSFVQGNEVLRIGILFQTV